jgi:hypothetical protein
MQEQILHRNPLLHKSRDLTPSYCHSTLSGAYGVVYQAKDLTTPGKFYGSSLPPSRSHPLSYPTTRSD